MKSTRGCVLVTLTFVVLLALSTSAQAESEDQTTGGLAGGTTQNLSFAMTPSSSGATGGGSANLEVQGTVVSLHLQLKGANPSLRLMVLLKANGTSHAMANATASGEGEVEAEASIALIQGTYMLGVEVLSIGSNGSSAPFMTSDPQTQTAVLQSSGGSSGGEDTHTVNTYHAGETEDDGIAAAIRSSFIPAIIEVGTGGSTVNLNDPAFSVSVGTYQGDGYVISIGSKNASGPRVLMVNLTSALTGKYLSSVGITIDGAAVQQASFSQVMGGTSDNSSRFVMVSGNSGQSLLILIPHFSSHTIAIVPILARIAGAVLVDAPVLLAAVGGVTLVIFLAYVRRMRVGTSDAVGI